MGVGDGLLKGSLCPQDRSHPGRAGGGIRETAAISGETPTRLTP